MLMKKKKTFQFPKSANEKSILAPPNALTADHPGFLVYVAPNLMVTATHQGCNLIPRGNKGRSIGFGYGYDEIMHGMTHSNPGFPAPVFNFILLLNDKPAAVFLDLIKVPDDVLYRVIQFFHGVLHVLEHH